MDIPYVNTIMCDMKSVMIGDHVHGDLRRYVADNGVKMGVFVEMAILEAIRPPLDVDEIPLAEIVPSTVAGPKMDVSKPIPDPVPGRAISKRHSAR